MALRLGTIVLDVKDMKRAIGFWTAALGYETGDVGDTWTSLVDPKGKGLAVGLQPNPEAKTDVNRVHMDLETADPPGEAKRLEKLGAKRIPWEYPPGATYIVMQDPEGNEFCLVRG